MAMSPILTMKAPSFYPSYFITNPRTAKRIEREEKISE
jgi:hypothetical protein